ncbi:uncharacterized protein METZ01_LOCUS377945, partial [marine metagenome]
MPPILAKEELGLNANRFSFLLIMNGKQKKWVVDRKRLQ